MDNADFRRISEIGKIFRFATCLLESFERLSGIAIIRLAVFAKKELMPIHLEFYLKHLRTSEIDDKQIVLKILYLTTETVNLMR